MRCEECQLMTSRLLDGEMLPDASTVVFAHLASCVGCRGFFHQVQELNVSLARVPEPLAGASAQKVPFLPRPNVVVGMSRWRRRVSFGVPVVVIAVCVFITAVVFSLRKTGEPERVYVTELPTVIVDANKASMNTKN
jgi:predicted anti-sigma-YlaC factor YlaD